jgi:hypothetical protein
MKANTFCCAGYSENGTVDYSRHVLSEHCSFCGSTNDEAPASPRGIRGMKRLAGR